MGENEPLATSTVLLAMGLTVFAGLSTGIGGLFVLLYKRTNAKLLAVSLGFSAGVMIFVSFAEFLFEAKRMLGDVFGESQGYLLTLVSFFSGMLLIALIDRLVPSYENPHESRKIEPDTGHCNIHGNKHLLRTGIMTAVIIAIHNFPEGMATFVASFQKPSTGIAIAIAVAIHNIPEGISVAMPIYCSTGSRRKAFAFSLLSGLAEPVGAVIAFVVLRPFLSDTLFGVLYAAIAGIMVFISLDELLPTAQEFGEHHLSIYGLITGMIVMAGSLLMLM